MAEKHYRLIKKMSTKTVYGSRLDIAEACLVDRAKPVSLFDVIGIARNVVKGETAQGPWLAFVGEFQAMSHNPRFANLIFVSGRLFLGGPAQDLLAGQMAQGGDNNVEFGFTITAQADEGSATGYTYNAVPLVDPAADNPVDRLRRRLKGGLLQLAAPPVETRRP